MKPITLRAHFDGKRICPDEPLDMKPDTELIVTLVPAGEADAERRDWLALSTSQFARAFNEDEAEYPLTSVREPNPEYAGR